ncbi:MAG: adenosylcobinamide-GDP ribazoletransferase, partial [Candidatus Dormibacteria bacterium]
MTFRSLRSAVAFLTVLPVGLPGGEQAERLGRAYFPAVGALVGLAAGCVFMVASKLTSPLPAALVAVATGALLTGGLHLDGLADFADGMFGGHDPERRLEIMHDPRVGSFAVVALTLVLVGDVAALSVMTAARALVGLIAAGALSRFSMLVLVALLPYARPHG